MTTTTTAAAVLMGLAIRIAIPLLITVVAVMLLARLDRQWQQDASLDFRGVRKPECWKTQNCSAALRADCAGFKSALPCWQVFRRTNGYLDEKCLGCPVLVAAPAPHHA